ncbi:MAG: SAM-dependent methyltransferase, partial [Actinomycetota bacterium]
LRTAQLQTDDLVRRARRGATVTAWHHTDPGILDAQGALSATAVPILTTTVFPALEGLMERLDSPSAAFLDVGTGVGRLAIAMCRAFPLVRVVGIDPWAPAGSLAARNVADAGLRDRIELRAQAVQDLDDVARYDAVWVPVVFLSHEAVARGLTRIAAALRPGGWVLAVTQHSAGRDLASSVYRLVTRLSGGTELTTEDVVGLLEARGYARVRAWPRFPGIAPRLVVGRRPE